MTADRLEPRSLGVEPLGPGHDREQFDAGVPALNDYLRKQANQEGKRGVAVTYVLVRTAHPTEILGYYTLSATAVKLGDLPETVSRKLPRYPLVPATLLGRLAVHSGYRGHGLGERLLVDALNRSLEASRSIASVAVFVDARDEAAAAFYERYGFTRLPTQPRRLFIPMKSVAQLWPTS